MNNHFGYANSIYKLNFWILVHGDDDDDKRLKSIPSSSSNLIAYCIVKN